MMALGSYLRFGDDDDMHPQSLMQAVAEVARVAGLVALESFGKNLHVETKRDGSPVTIADRAAERMAREWLTRHFPEDGILGEEFGLTNPEARRRWILDPIDGTKSFMRGIPLWGTLVAVTERRAAVRSRTDDPGKVRRIVESVTDSAAGSGSRELFDSASEASKLMHADTYDVLAGAAFFPAVDELVVAARACGCWWNGRACEVSPVRSLAEATVLATDDRFPNSRMRSDAWNELASRASIARTWGDCYGYLLVATGRAEVMVDDVVSAWDAAAIQPIVEEAGGIVTDWTGTPTPFGGDIIATNAGLATSARDILVRDADRAEPTGKLFRRQDTP